MDNQSKNYSVSSSGNILVEKFRVGRDENSISVSWLKSLMYAQKLKVLSGKNGQFCGQLSPRSPYTPVALSGTDLHFWDLDQ